MTWPMSCILNRYRLPIGHTKPDNSRFRDRLKAAKEKALAPLPTTSGKCPSSPSPKYGNLTISKGVRVTEMEQSQSSLMSKLPLEVRIMIYEEVLCRPVGVVHITTRKDGKLVHFRCQAENGRCRGLECFHQTDENLYNTWRTRDKDLFSTWSPSNTPDMTDGGLLGLLQSCRQTSVSLDMCNIVQMYANCNPATGKL